MSTETVSIASLGAKGDGVAHTAEGPVFVPYTLPGETVAIARVRSQGMLISLARPSPDRVEPPCRHFGPDGVGGTCGGCVLQHMEKRAYNGFKRQILVDALKSQGIDGKVGETIEAFPHQRRRMVLTVRRRDGQIVIGINQAETHHVVPLQECPIAADAIISRLDALKLIAKASGCDAFRIVVTVTLTGLDVSLEGVQGGLKEPQRRAVTTAVLGLRDIARVSINGEILIEPAAPMLDFGGARVVLPPGGFTQATREAEEAMAALAIAHIGKAKRVADLFAGIGTFALRLGRTSSVHAVESEDKAVKALDRAARTTMGLKPVTTERRDLFRRPLTPQELKTYDAVIFDPPRAGAEAQCRELSLSSVKRLVAVSCNPLTLARDLSILIKGGYRLTSVTPIDQFLWSSHVEAVALLER
ncbi:class I SAM-dependent RNA methyltransferase [Rhizobium sp. SSA_523]|uniref:class I SAM-dependent RNA methyltransferase n=1 Tax=Rhizobium sp. SSA_523 TaxID=2952477 RepID=UPI002091634D|nr:RsmD family RNA methyltransferase [Rhizobium sp. SSA_523]MCO5730516.1 RsmD family RNA methyltransferase [Rhizobium sp. SSA_523]WKC25555.1 RsmD family RNA methyltransferase [Rhizobium sp. SSA_523]